jgi:L-aminopeptidase/D-esterase-like protein
MGSITDVPGVRVGHASDFDAITGCTVILFDDVANGAVDLRGGGTSTRQIDSLLPHNTFGKIQGVLLTGGSAYGLDASGGVMRYLEERGQGFQTGYGLVVPAVPTAVLFDLGIGNGEIRPDAKMGYEACLKATSNPVEDGSVGVGTGATIGKLLGLKNATKGGIGSASYTFENGVVLGVLVAVNAFGDVISIEDGGIIAGVRNSNDGVKFLGTVNLVKSEVKKEFEPFMSTTLAVVVTNAGFSKQELFRISAIGQTGITRVISPSNTTADGDLVFAISCGDSQGDANTCGIIAAELISAAIISAVQKARSLGGIPCWRDIHERKKHI